MQKHNGAPDITLTTECILVQRVTVHTVHLEPSSNFNNNNNNGDLDRYILKILKLD